MEDSIDVILQDYGRIRPTNRPNPVLSACVGALLTGLYGVWRMFSMPGTRIIPSNLMVPYLPSSKGQTLNIMQLLEGRTGCLADLGSGDGRLVFAASSAGLQCTGFEINSILVAYSRGKACWRAVPSSQATFVRKTDLSTYNNVTAFLSPGLMEVLGEKLLKELPDDACVLTTRLPFPNWPQRTSVGSGLDQTFAYDISTVRSLRKVQKTVVS
ncbi:protein N-lysine methyltransferase FAM173B [Cottoperca gobio]|uniref:Protein N-lysine methyltransferase FAM173B n=1 Tax=Cottoperca gobio TaxID=56716 RepID=A0A6J2QFV2_COTGO|nr:protein N-lysine methyltransferase FAM173B-like [Cottoperca gobio]